MTDDIDPKSIKLLCVDDERHTPDAPSMIQRIVDRFETLNMLDDATKTGRDQEWGQAPAELSMGWRPVSCLKLRMMAAKLRKDDPESELSGLLEKAANDNERLSSPSDLVVGKADAVVKAADDAIVSSVKAIFVEGNYSHDELLHHKEVRSRVEKAIRAALSSPMEGGE